MLAPKRIRSSTRFCNRSCRVGGPVGDRVVRVGGGKTYSTIVRSASSPATRRRAWGLPPSFDLADAQNDLAHLDKLRPCTARLHRLLEKADDGETAVGSDVMSAALEGYAMLKVSGKGAGLDALRHGMSARFTRKAKIKALPAAA